MKILHQLLLILFVSTAVYTIDIKKKYFPVPVVLVLIGIIFSFFPIFSGFSISKDVLYEIFIPGLLFVSAYQFSARAMKKEAPIILTLSTIGMILTVFILGTAIYWVTSLFEPFNWNVSLLLAAILVPTDPVSVVSILKESTDDEDIADIVEGESMVNDGTSIVMFTLFLSMVQTGNSFSITRFLADFSYVSLGGIGVGLVFGWILSKAIHITSNHRYQVMLSILVAYGSFLIAEMIGVSGVLATVVSGILLSFAFSFTKEGKNEEKFRNSLGGFWNVIEPLLLSILFLFIGIQAAPYLRFSYWHLAFIIFILSVLARFIVLGGTLLAVPVWRKKFRNLFSVVFLLSWAGIKGSMSVVLLLWTEGSSVGNNNLLISLGFATIMISLILQSIGIYPLSKTLKDN